MPAHRKHGTLILVLNATENRAYLSATAFTILRTLDDTRHVQQLNASAFIVYGTGNSLQTGRKGSNEETLVACVACQRYNTRDDTKPSNTLIACEQRETRTVNVVNSYDATSLCVPVSFVRSVDFPTEGKPTCRTASTALVTTG